MSNKVAARKGPPGGRRPAASRKRSRSRRVKPWWLSWGLWATVAGLTGAIVLISVGGGSGKGGPVSGKAPAFTLTSTSGRQVSLSSFAGKNVLFYFSEGVGCDACFYQMVDIEKHLADFTAKDVTVIPIVMNPAPQVVQEMSRFGLKTPFLIDTTGQVSSEYHVLGTGMHANLPGHSFVLVDSSGDLRWTQSYPSMYVSSKDILSTISSYLR